MIGPLLLLSLRPKTPDDRERLDAGLRQMLKEDPMLHADTDAYAGTVTIGGSSELQLEILVDRLTREFHVEAAVDRLSVAYREALTCAAEGEATVARPSGEGGEYAHVKIRVAPRELHAGFAFQDQLIPGTIPERFLASIRMGIEERSRRGVLAGYPLDDVRAELYDGSYHDRDSSESAFARAGAMAFEIAATKAVPVLLEPLMRVEVVVPQQHASDVIVDLFNRRGQLRAGADRGGRWIVEAIVPLSELLGYGADLRSRTRGRGVYLMEFAGYHRLDPDPNEDDRSSWVGAPLKPAPRVKRSAIALPEPDDESADLGPSPA